MEAALGDYVQAKAYCVTQGGYLTDILDQETQDLLLSNIPSVSGVNWMAGADDITTVSYKEGHCILFFHPKTRPKTFLQCFCLAQ